MDNIERKSIEIVRKLEGYISVGLMKMEDFPADDVMRMVMAEYRRWLTEKTFQIRECVDSYDVLIKEAIENGDRSALSELLKELIEDMQKTPVDAIDRLGIMRKRLVERLRRYSREIYERYYGQSPQGEPAFHGKGVVYTVITGDYDVLKEPEWVNPALDYICFTDSKELKSITWDIRQIGEAGEGLDNVRAARKHKILCHKFLKEYDYSIYVDGKIQITGDLVRYADKYSRGRAMLCFPHFKRECAYAEAEACIALEKDNAEIIQRQMEGYRQEGYPENYGMIDSACLVRQHHDEMLQKVMECWWKEVRDKSRRDQLSVGYACWKNGFQYDICDLFVYENEFICNSREGNMPY